MENNIKTLRIQNFKSIKDVTMTPRRVNLIIGMPNVGKSNILEAMSLLGAGLYETGAKFMEDILRYEFLSNLFYDNDTTQPIIVDSSEITAVLQLAGTYRDEYKSVQIGRNVLENYRKALQDDRIQYQGNFDVNDISLPDLLVDASSQERFGQDSIVETKNQGFKHVFNSLSINGNGDCSKLITNYSDINILPKAYTYRSKKHHHEQYRFAFLKPPFGVNLLDVVYRSQILRNEIVNLFMPYNLQMVLRVNDRKFEIQKNINNFVYNYPYSSIADTLQRMIFYLAAIESNSDSVILFEEPEAHSYPVYVSMLGQRIVESRNNQFFVATHTPYLITEVLEQMLPDDEQANELAIFIAYYEDYQTKVKQLSEEEVEAVRGDSVDIFYNMDRYIPRPTNG